MSDQDTQVRQPLVVRTDASLPKPQEINWHQVSEVQVYGRLNDEGKTIVNLALTNKTRRVHIRAMDDEAGYSVDHFVT